MSEKWGIFVGEKGKWEVGNGEWEMGHGPDSYWDWEVVPVIY